MANQTLYDFAKLRTWREETGQSVTQAAAAMGISYPYLRAMESGTYAKNPTIASLDRLATFYGHTLAELVTIEVVS